MRRLTHLLLGVLLIGGAGFWIATRPAHVDPGRFAGLSADPARGEQVFHAAGCASCHMTPGATGADRLVLAGGQRFPSPFGTFVAPNISPDPNHGIGGWSVAQLADAVLAGVSPDGRHYYPVFPWDSYGAMAGQDLVDLHGYLATLPASAAASAGHELPLPFRLRRGLGLWKLAFSRDGWVIDPPDLTDEERRGRYLVEVMGHCAECHTPRAPTGALQTDRWLSGGPDPSGKGRIPNITPAALDWSADEIAEYLRSGFTPDFDSAGGHMALVVDNYAQLPDADRLAVAAYLKRVPPVAEPR